MVQQLMLEQIFQNLVGASMPITHINIKILNLIMTTTMIVIISVKEHREVLEASNSVDEFSGYDFMLRQRKNFSNLLSSNLKY